MKKLNLICASIAVLCASAVNAGTLTAPTTNFALEQFSASAPVIRQAAATYTVATTNGIVVNSGGKLYFTVALQDGAKFSVDPTSAELTGSILTLLDVANGGSVAVNVSADKKTAAYTITAGTNPITIGVGSTLVFTPQAAGGANRGWITDVKSALGTANGTVSVKTGLSALAASGTAADGAATIPADVDGPSSATAVVATSKKALTLAASVPSTADSKIDVAANPVGSKFVSTAMPNVYTAPIAKVAFTATAAVQADGATAYGRADALANNGALTVDVTPNAGKAWPVGSRLFLARLNAQDATPCTTAIANSGVTVTSGNASAKITLTLPAAGEADAVTDSGVNVCVEDPQSGTPAKAFTPIAPTVAATVAADTANFVGYATTTSGNAAGYVLDYNGSDVEVKSYWPGKLNTAGFTAYLRITNTGNVDANISLAHVDPATGVKGASTVLNIPGKLPNGLLAKGQSVLLTTDEIDAVVGAAPTGFAAGRAHVSGKTDGLRVQSLLQSGSLGTIVEYQ